MNRLEELISKLDNEQTPRLTVKEHVEIFNYLKELQTYKKVFNRYLKAHDRYEKEKNQDVIHGENHKVGSLNTFNQCCILRQELIDTMIRENVVRL